MLIVGHRGARGLAPENTIAGIEKALQHGVDQVEFDVRVTRDGVPILHHSAKLADPDGRRYVIAQHTFQELQQHKSDLATFQAALEAIGDKATPYVEVKWREPVMPIVTVLAAYLKNRKPSAVLLGSKSQKTLRALHKALPEVPKIVIEPWSGVRAHWRARQVNTNLISMNQVSLWGFFIKAVARSNSKLYTYTLNDPAKARRWAKAGLYAIVTDYPDRFEK